MYTYIILAAFLFLISGVIFKKNIMKNQFLVYTIIVIGSLIGTTIVNGILGLDIPYSKILKKEYVITDTYNNIVVEKDTLKFYNDNIFDSTMLAVGIDSLVTDSILSDTLFWSAKSNIKIYFSKDSTEKLVASTIFVPECDKHFAPGDSNIVFNFVNDTIPRVRVYKFRRIVESKWIATHGLPSRGDKFYEVDLPDTPDNRKVVEFLNKQNHGSKI